MLKNTTEKCCGHCEMIAAGESITTRVCANENCLCHTTTENGWEEEFEKLIHGYHGDGSQVRIDEDEFLFSRQRIRDFIQQIAKEEYERGRKDVVEFVAANLDRMIDEPLKVLEAALEAPNEETP